MTQVAQRSYTIEQFVAEVGRMLEARGETPETIHALGPLMQRLVHDGGDLWTQGEERHGSSGLESRLLYADPGGRFRLVLTQFSPGEPTPVHSHFAWGIVCGYGGRERYTTWERVDDGSRPRRAKLRLTADHHLLRGDLGFWYNAPRNIHRQWAEGDEPSCELILLGREGDRQHHFDLEKGTYQQAPARR